MTWWSNIQFAALRLWAKPRHGLTPVTVSQGREWDWLWVHIPGWLDWPSYAPDFFRINECVSIVRVTDIVRWGNAKPTKEDQP